MNAQGVPSLDSAATVQKWHAAWQQAGCPAPGLGSAAGTLGSSGHSAASSGAVYSTLWDEQVRPFSCCFFDVALCSLCCLRKLHVGLKFEVSTFQNAHDTVIVQCNGMLSISEEAHNVRMPLYNAGHLKPRSASTTFGHQSAPPIMHPSGHITSSHIPSSADMFKYTPSHLPTTPGSADLFRHAPNYPAGLLGHSDAIKAASGHHSADVYSAYNADPLSRGGGSHAMYPGLQPPGFGGPGAHAPAAGAAVAHLDSHLADGLPHRGPYNAPDNAPLAYTQPVTLAPDDHSWSAQTNNGTGPASLYMPPHAGHLNHSYSRASVGAHSQAQQASHWPVSQGRNSISMSWNTSPHSSTLSRATPSPPNPPPGFTVSSNKGPRHLLIMYSLTSSMEAASAYLQAYNGSTCIDA